MSKNRVRPIVAAIAFLLTQSVGFAQPRSAQSGDELKMVVILSRHGVRSPTWTQERLNSYSSLPWPEFKVPPGNLTDRGFRLIQEFGSYDRTAFAAKGLLSAKGCDDSASTFVWADTDQRTIATGKAFAEGLFPGCGVAVHSLEANTNDPLFHPPADAYTAAVSDAAFDALRHSLSTTADLSGPLADLQNILQGCAPGAACQPARQPKVPLLGTPAAVVRGKGDHLVDVQGPLPTASTLSEDLLLEYADGFPADSVGWGHVDAAELRRLLGLHTAYFDLIHRTAPLPGLEAAALLNGIAKSLQQAVEGKSIPGAKGNAGEKLLFLAGHDTNLAGVAALLGVHWTLDGRTDDTPPGTELVFELWQAPSGSYSVSVSVAFQSLAQMRALSPLTLTSPPASQMLSLPECNTHAASCPWAQFSSLATRSR